MNGAGLGASGDTEDQRLDKWLWHARLARTRSLATALIEGGKIRVNRQRVVKSSHCVKPGDVITAALGGRVRIVRVSGFAVRRGSAAAILGLYEELTPVADRPNALGEPAGGDADEQARRSSAASSLTSPRVTSTRGPAPESRPSKRDRRKIVELKGRDC